MKHEIATSYLDVHLSVISLAAITASIISCESAQQTK